MGDVLYSVCTVIQATCLLNTVLCVNFDIRLVSFDLELVDNRDKAGQDSVILDTKVKNTKNKLKPVKPKSNLQRLSDHYPEPQAQLNTQPDPHPDLQLNLQSDSRVNFQSDTELDSQYESQPEPQPQLQAKPQPKPETARQPEHNPDLHPDNKPDHQSEGHKFSPPQPPSTKCYQLPEKTQVEFVLSSMKHELTQVFIKTNEWLRTRLSKKLSKLHSTTKLNKMLDRKLNMALQKRAKYIENAHQEMVNDYTELSNAHLTHMTLKSNNEIKKRHSNSCMEFNVVEELWQKVLKDSSVTIKNTIHDCVENYLADLDISQKSALGVRVKDYILDNMKNIKERLLEQLCDKYQLCYGRVVKHAF